jgi:hypothetical protein
MAKDLPYFKFFCSEWSDGDITLETYETQGLFINICAYYWSNECVLELSKLKKRFRNDAELVDLLIENNLIKVNDGYVIINFLNEQKFERNEQSKVKSIGGKASAEAKRLAKLQQEINRSSTENQHVLKSCSTESQVLREDKIREDNTNTTKHQTFTNQCLEQSSWCESISMREKIAPDKIQLALKDFNGHLTSIGDEKQYLKDYQYHFVMWVKKRKAVN